MRKRSEPINDAHVVAIHPGGARLPDRPMLSEAERLAAAEQRMLDLAIERHVDQRGELAELAVTIIALRASVRAAA